MYQTLLLSQQNDGVKELICDSIAAAMDELLSLAESFPTIRQVEELIWEKIIETARLMMSYVLSVMCRAVTERDIADRGLRREQVRLRQEKDYWVTLTTTLGPVAFFSFAYRDSSSGLATVTRTPARKKVFPLHSHCRSTELCLEWECRLGSDLPFRRAQESMDYFTHGAVKMEDTTIARHAMVVGELVSRDWLYQEPEKIRQVLWERATRDLKTGRPLIYLSTDAHALRRFVDDTWTAQWKMANGLRLWCIDRRNGAIIHLGGEFTWGDCHEVSVIVDWLISTGHLPADGDYGEGVVALPVILTDGMPWIEDYVIAKYPQGVFILDAYHVMERLMSYANTRFGKGTKRGRKFYDECLRKLLGERQKKKARPRKSDARQADNEAEVSTSSTTDDDRHKLEQLEDKPKPVTQLLDELSSLKPAKRWQEKHDSLVSYLQHNAYRIDYIKYRLRGFQIGSGAMESLHRTGSQRRLKLPGAKWLPESSQALFNLRMLYLCGRWNEFWHQQDFYEQLVKAFAPRSPKDKAAVQEAA